jgi:hypothetical protein
LEDGTPIGYPVFVGHGCWDYVDYFYGDRTRYVVTGASAGGHLALMVGMTRADAGFGPTSPADFKIAQTWPKF